MISIFGIINFKKNQKQICEVAPPSTAQSAENG